MASIRLPIRRNAKRDGELRREERGGETEYLCRDRERRRESKAMAVAARSPGFAFPCDRRDARRQQRRSHWPLSGKRHWVDMHSRWINIERLKMTKDGPVKNRTTRANYGKPKVNRNEPANYVKKQFDFIVFVQIKNN